MSPLGYKEKKRTERDNVYKHWHTYLLAICACLLSACVESDVVVPPSDYDRTGLVPISFEGSHVDHSVTRHANNLSQHLSTMGVWGWCTGMNETDTPVFVNQAVAYNADSARWEYSPVQYWREQYHYTFCAYAPHQQGTGAEVSVDTDTHMLSISHISLHGHNLQDTPTDTLVEIFAGTPDTDWMVARSGQTAVGEASMGIEFAMQHILGKLNIRIKECEELAIRPHLASITADSIVIGPLPAQGSFSQQLTHTPIVSQTAEADIQEWTAYDTTLYINGTRACVVGPKPTYLVESLVIPQPIGSASTLTLHYSYHFKDGHTEECTYRMPLTDAFSRFVSGYSHTLTFTVCSNRIEFEAGAINWDKAEEMNEKSEIRID
jgi:hypothetical protein